MKLMEFDGGVLMPYDFHVIYAVDGWDARRRVLIPLKNVKNNQKQYQWHKRLVLSMIAEYPEQ